MTLKVAYFQPSILAIDDIPPPMFVQLFNLAENLHSTPNLADSEASKVSLRGGQQVQVYPNNINLDVSWLITWLETICKGYMDIVTQQSGAEELALCKPVITNIWTIRQKAGDYQEMHSHPGGNLSGNLYIQVPDNQIGSSASDGQLLFRLPVTKDITKFIMNDTWKYTPTPATMVVFPSHLPHTVYPWKGDGNRTVISFDAVLRPKNE